MSISDNFSPLFLAIDQGGQSSRVAIYDDAGRQLACFSSPCVTRNYTAADGSACVEQDGEEILAGIRAGLNQAAGFLGEDISRLAAAGFAGQGSSLLCWHKQTGAALSPVLSWQDRRAQAITDALPYTQQQIQERTGLRISPHYGAGKMRWCLDNLPAVQNAYKSGDVSIGPIASYLFRHLLRGDSPTPADNIDPGHAQRTLLWNLRGNCWDAELLAAFAIDPAVLPDCRWHNSHFGNLIINQHEVPLISCQRDQGASLFARGAPDPAACYVNIGTGAFIQRTSNKLVAPDGLLVSPLWCPEPVQSAPGIYAWESTVNGAAAALDWLAHETGFKKILPAAIEQALALEPQQPIYLLNSIGGLSAPYWRTDLIAKFGAGREFNAEITPQEKILAWIESVIFQIAVNIALMQTTEPLRKIYISGGLSRAAGVCQRLADLTDLTVYRGDNADATLQGVAYTAAGWPENWRPDSKDEFFDPQPNVFLHKRFSAWQQAMSTWLAE